MKEILGEKKVAEEEKENRNHMSEGAKRRIKEKGELEGKRVRERKKRVREWFKKEIKMDIRKEKKKGREHKTWEM